MYLSAKTFFDDKTPANTRLLFRAETQMPVEWLKRFRKNVVSLTPRDSAALRRNIITQAQGGQASVGWRVSYARAQEYGGHDYPGQYKNYTTPGTGPHFGRTAFQKTQREMPAVIRELGLTK